MQQAQPIAQQAPGQTYQGYQVVTGAPVQYVQAQGQYPQEDSMALVLLIVGFFFGGAIIWGINWCMYKDHPHPNTRLMATVSGWLALLTLLIPVLVLGCCFVSCCLFTILPIMLAAI
jgi:hypothetical protein